MGIDISENFNLKKAWTFDSRNMRQSYAELLAFNSADFIPLGFPVSVFDEDPELRGVYQCVSEDPLTWEKISSSGAGFRFENWVPGPWSEGSVAINGDYIAMAKTDIADSQVAPTANNAYWQILVSPYALATITNDGLMSKEDKTSLGTGNTRSSSYSFSTGSNNFSNGTNSITGGQNSEATAINSQASGYYCKATAREAHAFGYLAKALGSYSFAEGLNTNATGIASHAEGWLSTASGDVGSHAEGDTTTASGNGSHSQNYRTRAVGNYSHSGGIRARAVGVGSFNHSNNVSESGYGSEGNYSAVIGGTGGSTSPEATNSLTLGGEDLRNTEPNTVLVPKLIVASGQVVDPNGNNLVFQAIEADYAGSGNPEFTNLDSALRWLIARSAGPETETFYYTAGNGDVYTDSSNNPYTQSGLANTPLISSVSESDYVIAEDSGQIRLILISNLINTLDLEQ